MVARSELFEVYKLSDIFYSFFYDLQLNVLSIFFISSWYRFHSENKTGATQDAPSRQQENEIQDESRHPNGPSELSNVDHITGTIDDDESISIEDDMDCIDEEEQLKKFEKRVLYLLFTLQSSFYTSEAAIEYVAKSLTECSVFRRKIWLGALLFEMSIVASFLLFS